MVKQRKSLWTRIHRECDRFFRKMGKAAREPGKTIRHDFCRLVQRLVLAGPSELQDLLIRHYNSEGMEFCVRHLRDCGYSPQTIVDCGAFIGGWTRMVKKEFPQARVIMIEPQEDKRQILTEVQKEFSGTVEFVSCLLGPVSKEAVPFFEMESGSSVLQEMTGHPRRPVTRQMRTLDEILSERNIATPVFLKLDVQGFEIEVLKGARQTLQKTSMVVLEVAMLPFNQGAPIFHEVVQFMKEQGFVAYDICYAYRRDDDNVLNHVDIFFTPENSPLRITVASKRNEQVQP